MNHILEIARQPSDNRSIKDQDILAIWLFNKLRKNQLFDSITIAMCTQLAQDAEITSLSRSEKLFAEGDTGRNFFILLSGELQVLKGGLPAVLSEKVSLMSAQHSDVTLAPIDKAPIVLCMLPRESACAPRHRRFLRRTCLGKRGKTLSNRPGWTTVRAAENFKKILSENPERTPGVYRNRHAPLHSHIG